MLSTDATGRGAGSAAELTVLHQWRPDFLAGSPWRVSTGITATLLDAQRNRVVYGVTPQDAQRTAFTVWQPSAGWSEWRWFANWRYDLDPQWTAYGGWALTHLVSESAASSIVQQRSGFSLSVGAGRRFN